MAMTPLRFNITTMMIIVFLLVLTPPSPSTPASPPRRASGRWPTRFDTGRCIECPTQRPSPPTKRCEWGRHYIAQPLKWSFPMPYAQRQLLPQQRLGRILRLNLRSATPRMMMMMAERPSSIFGGQRTKQRRSNRVKELLERTVAAPPLPPCLPRLRSGGLRSAPTSAAPSFASAAAAMLMPSGSPPSLLTNRHPIPPPLLLTPQYLLRVTPASARLRTTSRLSTSSRGSPLFRSASSTSSSSPSSHRQGLWWEYLGPAVSLGSFALCSASPALAS